MIGAGRPNHRLRNHRGPSGSPREARKDATNHAELRPRALLSDLTGSAFASAHLSNRRLTRPGDPGNVSWLCERRDGMVIARIIKSVLAQSGAAELSMLMCAISQAFRADGLKSTPPTRRRWRRPGRLAQMCC